MEWAETISVKWPLRLSVPRAVARWLARCLLPLAVAGCSDRVVAPDTGSFALSVVSQASLAAVDSWRVTISGPSGTQTSSGSPGGTVSFSGLLPGSYSVLVEGFEGTELTQRGQTSVTVTAGSNTTSTVSVAPVPPAVSVAATDPTAAEAGPDLGTFTITRSGSTTGSLVVNVTLAGTATSGVDYQPIASTQTIASGQRTLLVNVAPVLDALQESPETVSLTIGTGSGYTVGSPSAAVVTIADAPIVTVTATDPNASEVGLDPGAFTVARTGATTAALAVTVTVTGTATAGSDYQTISTPVTIPAGAATVVVPVVPIADAVAEPTETVILTIAPNAALYAVGAPSSATVSIADAAPPVVTISTIDSTASEVGPSTGAFRIVRSVAAPTPLTVMVSILGTATNGVDYQTISSSQTIPAGASFVDVIVTPISDALVEGVETVVLQLLAGTGYVVGTPGSAGLTIQDAPPPVSLVASRTSVSFAAHPNGTSPVSQTVQVTATGGAGVPLSGTILYQQGTPGWLNGATLNTQSTPATLTLPIGTTSLAVGTYVAVVRLTSTAAATVDIQVNYTTAPGVDFGIEQFALIPAGSYLRGSGGGGSDELPVRTITISQPFRMQLTEVTQGQWRSVMGTNPSNFASCGDSCPVDNISWDDVQLFLQQLNLQYPGGNYRLPTEAEWEYAARAGTTTEVSGNNVLNDMGWWSGNSSNRTQQVARKRSNDWGLYDVMGNVWEWVRDFYGASYYTVSPATDPPGPAAADAGTGGTGRGLRGGAYQSSTVQARSAYRGWSPQASRAGNFGLRLVRSP